MIAGLLTLNFRLEGCDSLKERRQRLGGLRDRFGRLPQIAVLEEPIDNLKHACWRFLALTQTRPQAEQLLTRIEQYAATELDAVVTGQSMEWL